MKTIIIFLSIFFSLNCLSVETKSQEQADNLIDIPCITISEEDSKLLVFLDEKTQKELLGQRGCCSHHSGVCGCSGGRTQCCDGTQSPSCRC
jgi:hypothetical protein